MSTNTSPVRIELPHGRYKNINRVIYNPKPTGHVPTTWAGTPKYQWKGVIKFNNQTIPVWGYSSYPYPEPPAEWANDSY